MPSDNEWKIPSIAPTDEDVRFDWTHTFDDYRTLVRKGRPIPSGLGLVNFFTDDYRFEQLWTDPKKFLTYMDRSHWATTPDFSLYTDHPPAVHLWNVFRARYLGAFWQREGLKIIPTVGWAGPASYDYCFLGLPKRSTLAIATVGVLKNRTARILWECGYNEMVTRLKPTFVVCYGLFPDGFTTRVPHQILAPFHSKFWAQTAQAS